MGWPFIKTAAPANPYGAQGIQRNFFSDASAAAPIHPGQYNFPYNPYSQKYLVMRSFEPQAPAHEAKAVVLDVSLRGSGAFLTGAIHYQALLEPSNKSGLLT